MNQTHRSRILCPTCHQDMREEPNPGMGRKNCPRCGQGLSWRKAARVKRLKKIDHVLPRSVGGDTKILPCGCKTSVQEDEGWITFGPILCDTHRGKPISEWPKELREYYDLDLEDESPEVTR